MEDSMLLKYEDITIPVDLNQTVAAKEFRKRLPLTLSGRRKKDNYCFPTAIGCYDPQETQSGWKNGDVSIARGHFRILFNGEEESSEYMGMMVIGHIKKEDLQQILQLPDTVRLTITLTK